MDKDLIFTSDEVDNWFHEKYYASGSNARYFTWKVALGLLNQNHENPVIIETGCQRMEGDLGAGMSTSIFAEYIHRYGGSLISCDISMENLELAQRVIFGWDIDHKFVCSDSVSFLNTWDGPVDLIYLDSYDYPMGENQDAGRRFSQEHNLAELKAIWKQLDNNSIVLLDDNMLPGGGKPRLAKDFLIENNWKCLLDFQQSLWVRSI
jgi:hypothetical protein